MKLLNMKIGTCDATMTAWLHDFTAEMPDYNVRPAVVICPGGGYHLCSPREADPIASQFFAAGYQVFILLYSLGEHAANWQPMADVALAIGMVRKNSDEWGIAPHKIAVQGSSAGGHLAGSAGILWDAAPLQALVPGAQGENKPDAMVLCYPVITGGEFAHEGSLDYLTGGAKEKRDEFSLEKHIKPETPPCFLWHTVTDDTVPVENSMLLMQAFRRAGVSFEAHVFATGGHGTSICTNEVGAPHARNAAWMALCLDWLDSEFDFHARG